jgi:hypothetical protein
METKQLNSYNIEFYSKEEWNQDYIENVTKVGEDKILDIYNNHNEYAGLVSDISEELAEKIVDLHEKRYNELTNKWESITYKDYKDKLSWTCTAKQSFQTLSELPYVVISKI